MELDVATFQLEYWHWLVLGILLIVSEIFVPSFIMVWFGLGALIVGGLLKFTDIGLTYQLLIWAVSSIVFILLWFKFVRPLAVDRTKAGLGKESIINETGMVIKVPANGQRGKMRFSTPKLGNDEWLILSEQELADGDRVRVISVSGNSLVVEKA